MRHRSPNLCVLAWPLTLLAFAVLAGCQGKVGPEVELNQGVARPKPSSSDSTDKPDQQSGFVQLPSTEDVLSSYPIGRADPFAPVDSLSYLPPPRFVRADGSPLTSRDGGSTGISNEQIAQELKDFVVTGIVGSTPETFAIVQNGSLTGSVSTGNIGGDAETGSILPDGWKVGSISTTSGTVTLSKKGARILFSIGGR